MKHAEIRDRAGLGVKGTITARTWDVSTLTREIKSWPTLDEDEQHAVLSTLSDDHATSVARIENIALDGLLGFIARGLNPADPTSAEASHLALGTGTAAPVEGGTELTAEVYRTPVGDADVGGSDLLTSTFISQAELNGITISEVGLAGGSVASGEPMLTHAVLDPADHIQKNSTMVVTINYELSIRRPTA